MKTTEIIKVVEDFAPLSLSREYCELTSGYDNSGLLIYGKETEHSKMLVCMDLTQEDIDFAVENGIKFILTHHPYIYGKIGNINLSTPQGREIAQLLQNEITVYSAHLNLDVAKGGVDDTLCKMICGEPVEIFHRVAQSGYGKLAEFPQPLPVDIFAGMIEDNFYLAKFVEGKDVQRVAVFCGSGLSEEGLAWGIANGADTFVSSDVPHHIMVACARNGANCFDIWHGDSEYKAMQEIIRNLKFGDMEIFFSHGRLIAR